MGGGTARLSDTYVQLIWKSRRRTCASPRAPPHATTWMPIVRAVPMTVLAMDSSRRCLRCASVALILAIS